MAEDSGDRRRGKLDPERAALTGIVDCARVLFAFAKGSANFIETPAWTIEPYSGIPGAAQLLHHPGRKEVGEYIFHLRSLPAEIAMENLHRRAREGSGVSAFSDMEHMATALAAMAEKNIRMVYPLFGQRDTEKFLLARGYSATLAEGIDEANPLPALERIFSPLG